MFWRILRHRGVIPLLLVLAIFAYWKLHTSPPKPISTGYVADRDVTLWNTLAQVKQPVAELHYGERLEVLREEGTSVQVRTASNTTGWLQDSRQIMDSQLWEQSAALLAQARTLPVQATGKTKTVSNARLVPGRDGKRIFQFMRGTPVVVLKRAVEDIPQTGDENSQSEKVADPGQKPKREDWFLVLRAADSASDITPRLPENTNKPVSAASNGPVSGGPSLQGATANASPLSAPIAGWILARFVELDLPGPVRDYASSADLHVIAWFELNRVADGSGGEAPQYLVAGSRGGEGQPCDFTMLRVYTWSVVRKRYETAYIESNLCGSLPIRVSQGAKGPEFRFSEEGDATGERTYIMQQTSVRLVKDEASRQSRLHH